MRTKRLLTLLVTMGFTTSLVADQICQTDDIIATAPNERYTNNGDGTVTDTDTDLMWQICLVGQGGDQCEIGRPSNYSWGDALLYIPEFNRQENLAGFSDWRLPNIRELATLAELQCARPAINLTVFPNSPSSHIWSSSPYQFYPHYSWYMDFNEGVYTYGDRSDSNKHIRLVRQIDY